MERGLEVVKEMNGWKMGGLSRGGMAGHAKERATEPSKDLSKRGATAQRTWIKTLPGSTATGTADVSAAVVAAPSIFEPVPDPADKAGGSSLGASRLSDQVTVRRPGLAASVQDESRYNGEGGLSE